MKGVLHFTLFGNRRVTVQASKIQGYEEIKWSLFHWKPHVKIVMEDGTIYYADSTYDEVRKITSGILL